MADDEQWDALIKLVGVELKKRPTSHWLLTQMASSYYEKKDYDTAYKFILDAVLYNKDCPLALWHLACIFRMQDKQEDAITIWEELVNRGLEGIAFEECGEGLEWARSLINDCNYMISKTYKELGDQKLAETFKQAYMEDVSKGVQSIYDPATL